jgi:transposase
MEQKALLRGKIMELVKRGQMTIKAASKELDVSYRQGKRIYAAYLINGDKAFIHGNMGKASSRRISDTIRKRALEVYREKYPGFGPTLTAKRLRETEGISAGISTLRRWLMAEGLWMRKERRTSIGTGESVLGAECGTVCGDSYTGDLSCDSEELGAKVIPDNKQPPQVKGRVEQNHGPDPGRLMKGPRLTGLSAAEGSENQFPLEAYLPRMNT